MSAEQEQPDERDVPGSRDGLARENDGHGQRLSAVDSAFLSLESAEAHMHIGWSAVFAADEQRQRPTISALRARAAARLHVVPRCRQRLHASSLGSLGGPRWIDDERFDLVEHIVEASTPDAALSLTGFAQLRDALLSEPLDRSRPLWHIALIPRLEDGRVAVVGRVHHAMADGTAAMQLSMLLLDLDAEPEDKTVGPLGWVARDAPGALQWAAEPLVRGSRLSRGALQSAARAAQRPRSSVRAACSRGAQVVGALRHDTAPRAPDSSLNNPNGPRRTLVGSRARMDDLRAAQRRSGATINDVALAVVAGALRALALEDGHPTTALKAMIPVSVRRPHEYAELGNRIAPAMVWLPLHLSSPAARLTSVHEQTERFKTTRRPEGGRQLVAVMGLIQGPVRGALLRQAASPRAYNVVFSNVRGPSAAMHMLGARLESMSPVVPIGHEHGLAIGAFSHGADLHFGLHADPDAFPHAARLPALMAEEVRTLATREVDDGGVTSLLERRLRVVATSGKAAT